MPFNKAQPKVTQLQLATAIVAEPRVVFNFTKSTSFIIITNPSDSYLTLTIDKSVGECKYDNLIKFLLKNEYPIIQLRTDEVFENAPFWMYKINLSEAESDIGTYFDLVVDFIYFFQLDNPFTVVSELLEISANPSQNTRSTKNYVYKIF